MGHRNMSSSSFATSRSSGAAAATTTSSDGSGMNWLLKLVLLLWDVNDVGADANSAVNSEYCANCGFDTDSTCVSLATLSVASSASNKHPMGLNLSNLQGIGLGHFLGGGGGGGGVPPRMTQGGWRRLYGTSTPNGPDMTELFRRQTSSPKTGSTKPT